MEPAWQGAPRHAAPALAVRNSRHRVREPPCAGQALQSAHGAGAGDRRAAGRRPRGDGLRPVRRAAETGAEAGCGLFPQPHPKLPHHALDSHVPQHPRHAAARHAGGGGGRVGTCTEPHYFGSRALFFLELLGRPNTLPLRKPPALLRRRRESALQAATPGDASGEPQVMLQEVAGPESRARPARARSAASLPSPPDPTSAAPPVLLRQETYTTFLTSTRRRVGVPADRGGPGSPSGRLADPRPPAGACCCPLASRLCCSQGPPGSNTDGSENSGPSS